MSEADLVIPSARCTHTLNAEAVGCRENETLEQIRRGNAGDERNQEDAIIENITH